MQQGYMAHASLKQRASLVQILCSADMTWSTRFWILFQREVVSAPAQTAPCQEPIHTPQHMSGLCQTPVSKTPSHPEGTFATMTAYTAESQGTGLPLLPTLLRKILGNLLATAECHTLP